MLKTRSGLPRHCTYQLDRDGKRRVRFRRRGVSVYLTGIPWSEAFMRQYAAALEADQQQSAQLGASLRSLPGSFSTLCASYYASPEFRSMRPGSQAERRGVLERFRGEHGHRPLKDLQRVHVRNIIAAKADTPEAGNNLLKALRVALNYAVTQDLIPANPALGVKRLRNQNPDGRHTWTEDEIAQFQATHPTNSRAGLALALLLCTGQRRGDVIVMGWQHVRDGRIVLRQRKTGRAVSVPIHPELARALAEAPQTNLTFLQTARGVPFSAMGFTNWFRGMCIAAGLPKVCSPHGLRKAACRRLAEAGCSANEIAAISGHASLREVTRYTAAADREHLADQAIARQLSAQNKQRSKLPNIPTRVYPTTQKR